MEQLEDRTLMSGTPMDATVLENNFDNNTAAEVYFVLSGHENSRMHIENEELHMGVRDTMVTSKEYVPSAEKPLEFSCTVNFSGLDSFYVLTRTEGSTAIGGYRSNNEIRTEISPEGKYLLITEVKNGSSKSIAILRDVNLPLNQDLQVKLTDDGTTITVAVEDYSLSGESSMESPVSKFGMTSWTGKETTDNHRIVHGSEVVQDDPPSAEDPPPVEDPPPEVVDEVFGDPNFTVFNDFEGDTAEQLRHVMSNHENRRNHYEGNRMIMGVRDTAVPEGQYEPTEDMPLTISFDANFPQADSLFILTRSEATTDVGGYRSLNEVRTEIDTAGKAIRIHEIKGGSFKTIATLNNVELPLGEDIQVELTDDGSSISITVGQYSLFVNTKETYSSFATGLSNWCKPIVVDNYGIIHGDNVPQPELDPLTAKVQEAVSAELTVQLNEEAAALSEDYDTEGQMLLTSVSVNNKELSRIQGIQFFERSSFYIHGNDMEPILRRRFPDIFPENLAEYVQRQAEILNEEPGHIQDRILMQQSDYRGILRGLLGTFENTMSDLLNLTVDKVAQMQAGNLSEYNLMRDLREAIGRANTGRYILEIADFYVHIPSAEELYREGERLFTEEQSLLQRIQSEQDRLVQIDNFRASFREWQLGHGVPDLAILIGEDRGTADNGYDGILDAREERRLGRAQRLVEAAMGAMLDRRIQMRVVPDEVTIENRLVYGGGGVTYMDVHAAEQETMVAGVMGEIEVNVDDRWQAEVGIAEQAVSSVVTDQSQDENEIVEHSETVELPVGTNELGRWWATAGEAVDIDWNVYVENEGAFRVTIRGFEEWNLENSTVVVDGAQELRVDRTVNGYASFQAPRLPIGGHTFSLRNVSAPAEVGVTPGGFTLTKIDGLAPIVESAIDTLLVSDHEEEFLNAGKVFRVEGAAEDMDVNELINHFAPILHFTGGERFSVPFAVDPTILPANGRSDEELDLSQYETGIYDRSNTDDAVYASVLRNEEIGEIAINYNFYFPRSNWEEHGGENTHEGDWEGATVYLKMNGDMRWVPDRVSAGQHIQFGDGETNSFDGGDTRLWNDAEFHEDQVKLYVGLGGHALYFESGETNWVTPGVDVLKTEYHYGNGVTYDSGGNVFYMPRSEAIGNDPNLSWMLYGGYWGDSKLLNGKFGDTAPRGPLFVSSGFPEGMRWLSPWDWSENFNY